MNEDQGSKQEPEAIDLGHYTNGEPDGLGRVKNPGGNWRGTKQKTRMGMPVEFRRAKGQISRLPLTIRDFIGESIEGGEGIQRTTDLTNAKFPECEQILYHHILYWCGGGGGGKDKPTGFIQWQQAKEKAETIRERYQMDVDARIELAKVGIDFTEVLGGRVLGILESVIDQFKNISCECVIAGDPIGSLATIAKAISNLSNSKRKQIELEMKQAELEMKLEVHERKQAQLKGLFDGAKNADGKLSEAALASIMSKVDEIMLG